jgi:hypothetical protein
MGPEFTSLLDTNSARSRNPPGSTARVARCGEGATVRPSALDACSRFNRLLKGPYKTAVPQRLRVTGGMSGESRARFTSDNTKRRSCHYVT